jgi:hypothetical protein
MLRFASKTASKNRLIGFRKTFHRIFNFVLFRADSSITQKQMTCKFGTRRDAGTNDRTIVVRRASARERDSAN